MVITLYKGDFKDKEVFFRLVEDIMEYHDKDEKLLSKEARRFIEFISVRTERIINFQ